MKQFVNNIIQLSNETLLKGQPFLDPKSFSLRLQLHRTPKCLEMANLAVLNLGELLFIFDKVVQQQSKNVEEAGGMALILKQLAIFTEKSGLVINQQVLSAYSGHFCLLKLGEAAGIKKDGKNNHDDDTSKGAFGLVPPPPPPLTQDLAGQGERESE